MHFGCFQPVMAHTPWSNLDPWATRYAPKVMESYHYYAWLHKELVPYFYSHAYAMHENPALPVMRAGARAGSFRTGDELFVAVITSSAPTLTVDLPDGDWINYWDESLVVSGRVTSFPAPVGQEPTFIRLGSLIPMEVTGGQTGHGTAESAGALTVLVYPSGKSSFRYRDESANVWRTLQSELTGESLTLSVAPAPPGPPILYRIGRWRRRPSSLSIASGVVRVNQGGNAAEVGSEAEVGAALRGAWYYDETAQRLIVKAHRE
jgi:alpha-D-xyloside xylohydrolase